MSMQFSEIVDEVLAGSFAEAKRSSAKNWVRFRHAWLWDLNDWTFKYGTDTVTTSASSAVVGSLPTDLHAVVSLLDSDGSPLTAYSDFRRFYERYNTNAADPGTPEAFTVIGSQIIVGPPAQTAASDWLLVYRKAKPTLSNDSDTTGLPEGYDLALVHGGKAEGFKLATVPLWQGFDEDFTAVVKVMEQNYLSQVDAAAEPFSGAHRPQQWR